MTFQLRNHTIKLLLSKIGHTFKEEGTYSIYLRDDSEIGLAESGSFTNSMRWIVWPVKKKGGQIFLLCDVFGNGKVLATDVYWIVIKMVGLPK